MAMDKKCGTSTLKATVVLIGKTGSGKSMLANMLFDLKEGKSNYFFKVSKRPFDVRVSLEPQAYTDIVHGLKLRVVDTPGFLDTETDIQDRWMDILKAVNLAGTELNVAILVVSAKELDSGATCLKIVQNYMMGAFFNKLIILFTHMGNADSRTSGEKIGQFNRLLNCGTLGAKFLISDQTSETATINKKREEIIKCIVEMKQSTPNPIMKEHFADYTKVVLKSKLQKIQGENISYGDLCTSLCVNKELLDKFVSQEYVENLVKEQNQSRITRRQRLEEEEKKEKKCNLQ